VIDIHSHVLPFVDDGSDNMEMSLAMIREASEAGVTDLFLTPHYMRLRDYLSNASENREIFSELTNKVKQEGISIKLYLGNEIYYSLDILDALRTGTIIPLGNSNKVLVEFSLFEEDEEITEAIHNIKSLGYVPIIAHPERYPYISKLSDYEIIKQMGALIQLNASSIIGQRDKLAHKKAVAIIKAGLADFIASDQHVPGKNHLEEARNIINRKFGLPVAKALFENTVVLE